MHENSNLVLPGLVVALGVGAVAGALNFLAITVLRLPPIIATLAWSFVYQSISYNLGGEATLKPPGALTRFTVLRVAEVQIVPVFVMAMTVMAMIMLRRSVFGRHLLATGQSERAAYLAGVEVRQVRLLAYVLCGTLAALTGFLLSGFTGGAALNMGESYL